MSPPYQGGDYRGGRTSEIKNKLMQYFVSNCFYSESDSVIVVPTRHKVIPFGIFSRDRLSVSSE